MRRIWLFAAVGLLVGCKTPRAQLRAELGPRAADALQCPEDKLEFETLDYLISSTKVKVSGCQKTATYKLVESRWKRAGDNEPLR